MGQQWGVLILTGQIINMIIMYRNCMCEQNIKNYKDLYDILSAWWNLSVVNDICIVLIDRKSCMRDVYIITGDALIWRTWHWWCCYGFTFFVHNRFLSVFLQKKSVRLVFCTNASVVASWLSAVVIVCHPCIWNMSDISSAYCRAV